MRLAIDSHSNVAGSGYAHRIQRLNNIDTKVNKYEKKAKDKGFREPVEHAWAIDNIGNRHRLLREAFRRFNKEPSPMSQQSIRTFKNLTNHATLKPLWAELTSDLKQGLLNYGSVNVEVDLKQADAWQLAEPHIKKVPFQQLFSFQPFWTSTSSMRSS